MARRASRRPDRPHKRREWRRTPGRVRQWLRQLFSSGPQDPRLDSPDDLDGGLGVREPRRPVRPSLSGGVALELPPTDAQDVRAVGDEP